MYCQTPSTHQVRATCSQRNTPFGASGSRADDDQAKRDQGNRHSTNQ